MSIGAIFLIQALIIVTLPLAISRILGLARFVPLVLLQIVLGIALGPSLFGRFWPEAYHLLFNPDALTPLSGIAMIAVVFFAFISGLHLDAGSFRGRGQAFSLVAAASIVVPTLCGFLGGLWIASRHATEVSARVDVMQFAAAIGICMGVTALPVLAAILREMHLLHSRIGRYALGIAAVNDVILWVMLGVLLTLIGAQTRTAASAIAGVAGLIGYLFMLVRVVRPLVRRSLPLLVNGAELTEIGWLVVCGVVLVSAIVTEAAGVHYVIGAFAAGCAMPQEIQKPILDRLQAITLTVFMPFYFMLTGLRIVIDPGSLAFLEIFIVTSVLAIASKVAGTAIAMRLTGESWPEALGLGVLVQTKGLVEFVVLTVLRESGVISLTVFSALACMAVLSTALAMPLARLLVGRASMQAPEARVLARSDI